MAVAVVMASRLGSADRLGGLHGVVVRGMCVGDVVEDTNQGF
jgi:hypothetical protein